ncbi:DDE-type integrase/transposase/recombinase [Proteus mirabilis]|nr:DDE-type integrase/transposase/recombinase [Proteus mirabilis]
MANVNLNFNAFLEKNKLKDDGSNYADWVRNLKLILEAAKKAYVLDAPLGDPPAPAAAQDILNVWQTRSDDYSLVRCGMLYSLETGLQRRFEQHGAYEMFQELKLVFQAHARVERYEVSDKFFSCKMEENSSVSEHILKMSGLHGRLTSLGVELPDDAIIDRILQSLPPSYKGFVLNYNMQGMEKTIPELYSMLKSAEVEIKKEHQVLMVNKTTSFKKGKGKKNFKKDGKAVAAPGKPDAGKKKKNGPKPETECFYCKGKGHWKRNCPKYLADKKAGNVKGICDIHVIDVYLTSARSSSWVFDTGAVAHICNSKQELRNKRRLAKDEVTMRVGNGSKVDVIAVGTLPLHLPSGLVLNLNNCYLVPALSMNIVSGSCLMRDGYSFKSENNGCSIYMSDMFYGHAPLVNGLFLMNLDRDVTHIHSVSTKRCKVDNDSPTYLWHCRLGHIGVKRMKKLHTDGLLESLDFESFDTCEPCLMGKMTKTPFSGIMERATDLLEIIHTDVCGPMNVEARGGYRYVLTLTDDLSRYGYIYLMKHKSETFEKFKEFQSEVENQRDRKIKCLRSDRGGEYLSHEFGTHLRKCGIVSQLTPPGTPQRNGVSERRNRTLLDMVRSMMSLTDLPLSFWGYALETAAFTLNRAPSKSVETTPYELWFGKKPKLSFLKVWGCDAYVKKLQPEKLEPKAEKCVFIGYPKETIGYTFYLRSEGKTFVAKNGSFLEKEFLSKEVSGRKVELDEVITPPLEQDSSAAREVVPVAPTPTEEEVNDNDHEASDQVTTEPRRSTRARSAPEWYGNPVMEIMLLDNGEPSNYEEAMAGPDSNKWLEAMKSEIGSMYENKVWTLVDLPDDRRAIENKWIFKKKTDANGNVTVYKARLVAKGFRQIQGVDYEETFSPVAKLKSVRIMLAIAAFYDYEIWQMDVKTAFLNGNLKEELYMMQPEGFVDPKGANKVCKLQRSIYGLVQASRSWNIRFNEVIKAFGFIQVYGEACLYKKVSGSSVAFLILYVDDILLMGNNIEMLESIKAYLNKSFSMKDLGEAAYILGIKIYRDRSRRLIGLSQSTYLDKILKKFNMENSKKGFLPVLQGMRLSKTQSPTTAADREKMSSVPYASAVGSLMYAMLCTRPDINLAISLVGRYQSDPGMEHWTAVKNILKYLKRTKEMFLVYGGDEELVVKGYVDASFDTDPDDSKSQTGYVYVLNGGAVSWCSSKQEVVAASTCEAEYIAASEAAHEGIWMKELITDLGVVPSASGPMTLFCDNTGAIAIAKEPRFHRKTKHIKRRYNSIQDHVQSGVIDICKVHTDLNIADPLTKPLPRAKHDQHHNAMGVRYITM